MAVQQVHHVKERRSRCSSRIRDRKHRLQEPVEIRSGHRSPVECQRFIPIVPPAVGHAGWKDARFSGPDGDGAPGHAPAEHAAQHGAFLVLHQVNVQRRPGAVRRQRSFNLEDDLPSIPDPAKTQCLAGVTILELKVRVHHGDLLARRRSPRL
jgi:hypothetical protein